MSDLSTVLKPRNELTLYVPGAIILLQPRGAEKFARYVMSTYENRTSFEEWVALNNHKHISDMYILHKFIDENPTIAAREAVRGTGTLGRPYQIVQLNWPSDFGSEYFIVPGQIAGNAVATIDGRAVCTLNFN